MAEEELGELATEAVRDDLADLDQRPTAELVSLLQDEDATVARAVAAAGDTLATAIDAIVDRLASGGRLVLVGAGTSGRLAQLDAAECGPTFGVGRETVVAVVAGGDRALAEAVEGAEDDVEAGRDDLEALGVGPRDAVVAVSASGRTPYAVAALVAAADVGALPVAVACTEGSPLARVAAHAIEVLTGPEVIAGSTRLKAGTAQKLVLNTISTVTMVRLGKTYGNLMVDVEATNAKLRDRARRIVVAATGASAEEAEAALAVAGGSAKIAIVALLGGVDGDQAARLLARADGRVRDALEGLGR